MTKNNKNNATKVVKFDSVDEFNKFNLDNLNNYNKADLINMIHEIKSIYNNNIINKKIGLKEKILNLLNNNGPQSLDDLANKLNSTKNCISSNLSYLRKDFKSSNKDQIIKLDDKYILKSKLVDYLK